jgi:hypothetical protein
MINDDTVTGPTTAYSGMGLDDAADLEAFAPPPSCPYGSGPHRKRHERLARRTWNVPTQGAVVAGDLVRQPVTVVLVSGAIGDYTVYLGIGVPEWVADHGNKLAFEYAVGLFPGLDAKRYRE